MLLTIRNWFASEPLPAKMTGDSAMRCPRQSTLLLCVRGNFEFQFLLLSAIDYWLTTNVAESGEDAELGEPAVSE
jgi:hypothetical protein